MQDKKKYSDKELKEISRNLKEFQKEGIQILDNVDFTRLFHISRNTSLNWRKAGKIKYSRMGRGTYYKVSDVEEMMEEFRVKS